MYARDKTTLDRVSRTQTEIKAAYVAFIGAWFCLIYMIYTMNPSHRSVSLWVFVASIVWTIYAIAVGFIMRKKFFSRSTGALSDDLRKALSLWKAAHFMGFCCALNLPLLGVVLRVLGSSWIVAWIFFGLGLTFLLLWRPRQLALGAGQSA